MSEAARIIQRAKEVRQRLFHPPNAVVDRGINLFPHKYKDRFILQIEEEKQPEQPIEPNYEAIVTVSTEPPPNPKPITFTNILRAVSEHFNVGVSDLRGPSRRRVTTIPRQIAMFLARRLTKISTGQLGRELRRDHTTILHGSRLIEQKRFTDTTIMAHVETLERGLRAGDYS